MRPLFRSLFVFAVFGVIATHVSTGFLSGFASDGVPYGVVFLDQMLIKYLVRPLGADMSILVLYGVGAVLAIWTYVSGVSAKQTSQGQRHSTW